MLSLKVKESLEEAQGNLRTALFHASKNEKPLILKHISDAIASIDSMMKYEEMSDQIEKIANKIRNSEEGPFFF